MISEEPEDPDEPDEPDDIDDIDELNKFVEFLYETVFQIKGVQGYGHARIKKEILGIVLKNGDYDYYSKLTTKEIKDTYIKELVPLIPELDTHKQQKRERIII